MPSDQNFSNFFQNFLSKPKSRCLLMPKLNNFYINRLHQGPFQRRLTSFQGKNPNFQRSRRKRAERGRLRFWCLLEALKLVKNPWKLSQRTGFVMRIPKITLGSQNGGQTAEWRPIENRQNFAKLEFGNDGFNLVWRPFYATFFRFLFSARSGNEIRRMSFFLSSIPVP